MNKINKLSAIVAMTEKGVIGNNGNIPWYYKEDLKHFKDKTLHKPIIMGRKTYESICENFSEGEIKRGGPLEFRRHIILTRDEEYDTGADFGTRVVNSYDEAKWILDEYIKSKPVKNYNWKNPFIIGGKEIYEMFWEDVDELYLTLIQQKYEGDTYFPKSINLTSEWSVKSSSHRGNFTFFKLFKCSS